MYHNQTPPKPTDAEQHSGEGLSSSALFGTSLTACNDIEKLRTIAEKLWSLLDDIDTASDMFKPSDEVGYRKFYEYTMRRVGERQAILVSDGYDLFLPNDSDHLCSPGAGVTYTER
jgi:hypothetical protein